MHGARAVRGLRRFPAAYERTGGTETSDNRLAIIVVLHNSARWLPACLSRTQGGELELDVVVVDSGSTDDTAEPRDATSPEFASSRPRIVGFAAANNRGLEIVDAGWVLLLTPDTRVLSGSLEELVSLLRDTADGRTRPVSGKSTRTVSWTRRCGASRMRSAHSP